MSQSSPEIETLVRRLREKRGVSAGGEWRDPDCQQAADLIEKLRRDKKMVEAQATSYAHELAAGLAQTPAVPRIAERLADVIMMLDAPDAYNREYIAAVCRSILGGLSDTSTVR